MEGKWKQFKGELKQKWAKFTEDDLLAIEGRVDTLEGKTVAQLWDELFKGDIVFELLEEGLKKRYPSIRFVSWREFGSTHGGDERKALAALPQRLKDLGVDAVISGMAC